MSGPRGSNAVSRRALLCLGGASGVLGTGVLSGCDLDPRGTPTPATVPPDPDQRIVDAARSELRGLLVRLSATAGTASLVACHRIQLAALQGDPPPLTRRSRALTPAQTIARERRAANRLARWALACHSGDLARVLASAAAGIRMQPLLRGGR